MSVINQMLKDLDKRQGEQVVGETNAVGPMITKKSNVKVVILIVVIIVLFTVAGIFAWQLYSENQLLKSQAEQANTASMQMDFSTKKSAVKSNDAPEVSAIHNGSKHNEIAINLVDALESTISTKVKSTDDNTEANNTEISRVETTAVKAVNKDNLASTEQEIAGKSLSKLESEQRATKQSETVVTPRENNVVMTNVKESELTDDKQPSLSISRTQLSPQDLATKKIKQAEQAMEVNQLAKAESLFEEVLVLLPEHTVARKQLAALWYGKQAYQDAINVLSQGIALAPQAEDMRLMSARIYFEQGRAKQAFNLLTPVKNSQQVELQALLASVAAELNEHESAIYAYKKLLLLESNVGRWWLGLAVSLDSQGKFLQASKAYSEAIAKGNLSSNAMQFARQRISELGE